MLTDRFSFTISSALNPLTIEIEMVSRSSRNGRLRLAYSSIGGRTTRPDERRQHGAAAGKRTADVVHRRLIALAIAHPSTHPLFQKGPKYQLHCTSITTPKVDVKSLGHKDSFIDNF